MKKLYVSNKDETVRMFRSDFLELFSKVHWTVPLIIFVPIISYLLYSAFIAGTLLWWQMLAWFCGGVFVWTIVEYLLHRFLFHYEPPGKLGKRMHFIFHGVHHDYPNDSWRLVMPPAVSLPLAFCFFLLFDALIEGIVLYPFFAGFLFGYLCYDMLHYAIHHAPMKGKIWIALKTQSFKTSF